LPIAERSRELLLFCASAVSIGLVGYFLFLKILSYPTQPWYYLALIAFTALFLDLAFDCLQETRFRIARLIVVGVIWLTSAIPTYRQISLRMTNADTIAERLGKVAATNDLVVVTPWYQGISFGRYYRGPAPWLTVPPLDSLQFHRFDLIKQKMLIPNLNEPIRPLLDRIHETLQRGGKVWVVGQPQFPKAGEFAPTLSPPPDPEWGWDEQGYSGMWSLKTGAYLQVSALRSESIALPSTDRVSNAEKLTLMLFESTPAR
jgi:hypothetical protein